MKYIASRLIVLAVVLALLVPSSMVFAQDYLAEAAQALKQSSVYVAPGTERTDKDTAGKLQSMLKSDDNIVLVMFPAAAEEDLGTDLPATAARLYERLDRQGVIIGLAVGRKVVGYAPTLLPGVAADQMVRAASVSNDSVTALQTFVQNMHEWLRKNPQPTPMPTGSPEKGGNLSWLPWLLAVLASIAAAVWFLFFRNSSEQSGEDRTKFKAPGKVGELLSKIATLRSKVRDQELQESITQVCRDTAIYFQKYCSNQRVDTQMFETYLSRINDVLIKYVDVQEYGRYYDEPARLMREGREAIADFAAYVLTSCRRGSKANLVQYKVDTRILQAQRSLLDELERMR